MREEWTTERLGELRDAPVYDSDGDKIGKVETIFYDLSSGRPEWIGLGTGFFGTKRVLVPVAGAQMYEDGVGVPYTKGHVKGGPDVDADEISPQLESELYAYYGGSGGTGTGERAADTTAGDERGTVTRKEEELAVGTRPVEGGAVRLRKWVEEEPVHADVELTHERAHVSRERIDEPVGDHEFGEEQIEVPLRSEEPVVQKQAVAKERISVGKHDVQETQTVTDTVRKERVSVDGENVENVDDVD